MEKYAQTNEKMFGRNGSTERFTGLYKQNLVVVWSGFRLNTISKLTQLHQKTMLASKAVISNS